MTRRRHLSGRRPLAWRRRGFRQLTRAWLLTNVADSALYLSLAVWVKELTGSDAAAALVFAALGVPALAAPFLGHLADRVSRRLLLSVANAAVATMVLGLLVVSSSAQVWVVYAVTLAYASVGYLTSAAQSGLVRDLLDDDELAGGNGLLSSIDQGLRLVSPLAGAAVYAAFGPRAVAVTTAVCFAAAALQLWRVDVRESQPTAAAHRGRYVHEVTAGFRHLFRTPVLAPLTVAIAIGFGATGAMNAAVFPVMEQGLGVDPAALGTLVSLQGVGALAGGVTAAWAIRRLGEQRAVLIGLLLLALGIAPLVGTSLPAVLAGLVLLGGGVTWVVVAYVTMRQRTTPPALQGRASAASNMLFNVPQTAATFGAAALLALLDYRLLLLGTVAGVLLAAAVAAPWRRRRDVDPAPREQNLLETTAPAS